MHEYRAARAVFGFAEFMAWVLFALGVVALVGAFLVATRGGFLGGLAAALPAMAIILVALLIVVFIQVGRAGVDTSERVGRLIQINRDGFQYLKSQSAEVPSSFDLKSNPISTSASGAPVTADRETIAYNGYEIVVDEQEKVWVGEQYLISLDAAKRYIDSGKAALAQAIQPTTESPQKQIEYRGTQIGAISGGYRIDGRQFLDLETAKAHVDAGLPKERLEPSLSRPTE